MYIWTLKCNVIVKWMESYTSKTNVCYDSLFLRYLMLIFHLELESSQRARMSCQAYISWVKQSVSDKRVHSWLACKGAHTQRHTHRWKLKDYSKNLIVLGFLSHPPFRKYRAVRRLHLATVRLSLWRARRSGTSGGSRICQGGGPWPKVKDLSENLPQCLSRAAMTSPKFWSMGGGRPVRP